MSQPFSREGYVGKDHMPYLAQIYAFRHALLGRVSYFCQCLANDVNHQQSPILGHAMRIGEAKNPGPKHAQCLINVATANPTSVANKKDTMQQLLTQEHINVLCLAETSATQEVQAQSQKDFSKMGYKTCWSNPVAPQKMCQNGAASTRGRTGGTAILADVPIRPCRNPLPEEWKSTTRFTHAIASGGQSHIQIMSIYSIPQSHSNAKDYLNNLLTMTLQQASSIPLPYVICGDFNMELADLPIWEVYTQKGCQDLIEIHRQKFGCEMQPTCQGVTRPDNAIISRQLLPHVGIIKVLSPEWFATHCPVMFSLQLPQPQLFKTTLKLPQSWVDFGIEMHDLQKAYNDNQHIPKATTLEAWGQKLETLVDTSIHTTSHHGHGQTHLRKAYRGRCQPRLPVKTPVYSAVKKARQGDFDPIYEVNRMATKRQIKQLRRLQSLYRRLNKIESTADLSETYVAETQQEWITILKSTAFGAPFHEWLTYTPELGSPQWPLPTAAWLFEVNQFVQHSVSAQVAQDHAIFSNKCKFARHCDRKFHGSSQAFAKVKGAPALPIQEVFIPGEAECILTPDYDKNQVECFCENPQMFTMLAPVEVLDHTGWIIQQESHSFTVQFHNMPNCEELTATVTQKQYIVEPNQVADQLTAFWIPMWQAEHHVDSHEEWPEFQNLMRHMPTPPAGFQFDDSLCAWQQAVKKLRASSARGFDAVSAQELKQLPTEMLEELIHVCNNYPDGFPTWFMRTGVCPLNKADDVPQPKQSRPICILSQIYRLFASVFCTQVLQFWASFFPVSITGMLPSRGSHDAAYAMQVLIEMVKFQGSQASGLTLDIKKCFNCIRHEAGRRLLLHMGLPEFRVRQFLKSIKNMTRFWEINGQSFGPITSSCGFPEGDAHSVLVMLAVALLWASNVEKVSSPALKAAAYADNWSWHSNHAYDNGPAARATIQVTQACGLEIDWGKTWRWATNTETADLAVSSLQEGMPDTEVERMHNAKDLGFQLHYSGVRELGSRKTRHENGITRLHRLATLPNDLSTKEHILRSSVFPAMFYGTELFPVANDQLAKVRSAAAEALVGQSRSMSPALVLFLTKGSILDPEFVVISQALRTAVQWLSKQTPSARKTFFCNCGIFSRGHKTNAGASLYSQTLPAQSIMGC
jgi:exonuclease III